MLELPENVHITHENIETRIYEAGDIIVRPGDFDNRAYVVLDGSLNVYISPAENKQVMVKQIAAGNSFFSALSLLDILMVCFCNFVAANNRKTTCSNNRRALKQSLCARASVAKSQCKRKLCGKLQTLAKFQLLV